MLQCHNLQFFSYSPKIGAKLATDSFTCIHDYINK